MTYELKDPLPIIEHLDLTSNSGNTDEQGRAAKSAEKFDKPKINDHRSLNVRSVIDIHAWDRAKWRGTAFVIYPEPGPAIFALMFENKEAAESIFGRWRERFGSVDVDNEIDVTIVRGLPGQPRSHYCVKISAKQPDVASARAGQIIAMPSRLMTMEPSDSVNLDRFLQRYAKNSQYLICPAILKSADKPPEFLTNLAIQKTVLRVREAKDIGDNDMDSAALKDRA